MTNSLKAWILVLLLCGGLRGGDIGVLVIHGKNGTPARDVVKLADALRGRGYAVAVPVMPWAEKQIYSASYADALAQMDREAAGLRRRGASRLIIAGHSLGANAALGYAAHYSGLAGLALLAPGQFPENPDYRRRVAPERDRALRLVAAGEGDEPAAFRDPIQAFAIEVRATPRVFLGYSDPAGPAVMSRNAAAIRAPLPILLIQESNPAVTAEDEEIFRAAPPDPLSRYVHSPAEHVRVPDESVPQVLAWIVSLSESAPPRSLPAHR